MSEIDYQALRKAAQLAEANHPQTGDWLYDDPIELARAIRKGPDIPEFKSVSVDEDDNFYSWFGRFWYENYQKNNYTTSAKQMLGTMAEFAYRAGRESAALAGNSPVTPDGWISCSEQMPVIGELNWRTSFPLLVTCEIGVIPAYYGFVRVNGNKHYGFMESLKYGDDSGNHPQTNEYDLISNVTHWMPLPEPPQEVNRG